MALRLVKIENTSKPGDPNYRDLRMHWRGDDIIVPPGREQIVEFDVAAHYFGHPLAVDKPNSRDRTDTLQYVMFMWGYQPGSLSAAEDWAVSQPPFRVVTMEGEYMPMVLDDPAGVKPQPGDPDTGVSDNAETALLRAQMDDYKKRMEKLEDLIANREILANPGVVPPDVHHEPGSVLTLEASDEGSSGSITGDGVPVDTTVLPQPRDEAPVAEDAPRAPSGRTLGKPNR